MKVGELMNEPIFKNYKEKQRYYKEKYQNRGEVVWSSIRYGRDGKVIQRGKTYIKPDDILDLEHNKKVVDKYRSE